jgi:hypothetical protein
MFFQKLLALITALLACLFIGLVMLSPVVSQAPIRTLISVPIADNHVMDAGAARQEIEATILATPEYAKYFARLRETFTADYDAVLKNFAYQKAMHGGKESVDYYLSETVRQMRQKHGALAATAENALLSRVFTSQLNVLHALAMADKKMCVAFLYGVTNADFQTFAASRRELVSEMALAGLEAMLNGKSKNIIREKPSDTDFRVLEVALGDHGLSRGEIDALLDGKTPDPPIEDPRMCAAGQTYLEVLATLPEVARMRIYALAVQLMANS